MKDMPQILTPESAKQLAVNWRKHYEKQIRRHHNEWLLAAMTEYVDDLRTACERSRKAGVMSTEEYQAIIVAVEDELTALTLRVREVEEQLDRLWRLTGGVFNND